MSTDNPYDSPSEAGYPAPPSSGVVQLKSLGVGSCAKMMGALYAVGGLIAGAMISLVSLFGVRMGPDSSGLTASTGVLAIVFLPILYGIGGLIGGAIMAIVYNFVASAVGGVEMKLG